MSAIQVPSEHVLQCFAEIQQVLKKHNKLHRFGLSVLERPFDLDDGEIFLENHDKDARTLSVEPSSKDRLNDADVITTNWKADPELKGVQDCVSCSGACCFKR